MISLGLDQWRRATPRALLDALGLACVSYFQLAFQRQALGPIRWPARYPDQAPPKVNVAGVLADLNAGRTPPERRKDDRPALVDTGRLRASIAHRVTGDSTVEVGTTVEYAAAHQLGLETSQPVTQQAKDGLARLLRRAGWKEHRAQLGFLFARSELRTRHPARPFVGWVPELGEVAEASIADALRRA